MRTHSADLVSVEQDRKLLSKPTEPRQGCYNEELETEDAEIIIAAYGISARNGKVVGRAQEKKEQIGKDQTYQAFHSHMEHLRI